MNKTPRSWLVVYTLPNHERKICGQLSRFGVDAYLPLRREVRQWSDRKKKLELPLFSCYVFIHIDLDDRYKVFDVPGVIRFLDSNTSPTIIPENEIELIKKVSIESITSNDDVIGVGENVIITSGPLKGISGLLVSKKGTTKFVLHFETLRKDICVDISDYSIERISKRLTPRVVGDQYRI